jgi:hypothetical protein
VVECLRRAGTPYVVIGAWTLAIWGQPRATADLDLLVLAKEQELDRLGTFMTKAEMEVDETWQQWNPLLRGSQLKFQYRGVTIDLLLPLIDMTKRSSTAAKEASRQTVLLGRVV